MCMYSCTLNARRCMHAPYVAWVHAPYVTSTHMYSYTLWYICVNMDHDFSIDVHAFRTKTLHQALKNSCADSPQEKSDNLGYVAMSLFQLIHQLGHVKVHMILFYKTIYLGSTHPRNIALNVELQSLL